MTTTLDEDNRTALVKLEYIKEIRHKMLGVERLRSRLAAEVEAVQVEEASLADYKAEMDQLLQEKMAHVEELRQIHADINAMENIIKSGEEIRSKALENARRLYEEYQGVGSAEILCWQSVGSAAILCWQGVGSAA
ncbi:Zinc finger C4H2-type [Trinorchestia longiramus]|nr:Zinc finger C4H2-type [Trinorchestia longiramus]